MNKKLIPIPFFLLAWVVLFWIAAAPVNAEPLPQQITSPTPDENGRVVYVVQPQDTCLSIALRFMNGDVNRLIELNSLDAQCVIREGQELLLGIYEVPTPTTGPSVTPTSNLPSATPTPGTGVICVMLFDDINGNSRKDPEEWPIQGGAISITDREGITSLTGSTVLDADLGTADVLEPLCFENLPEGEYNVSVGPPEGYNPTTTMNYPLSLRAGDNSTLDFGAQTSSAGALMVSQQTGPGGEAPRRSPLLGIIGGVMLLFGIGLGIYLKVLRR